MQGWGLQFGCQRQWVPMDLSLHLLGLLGTHLLPGLQAGPVRGPFPMHQSRMRQQQVGRQQPMWGQAWGPLPWKWVPQRNRRNRLQTVQGQVQGQVQLQT